MKKAERRRRRWRDSGNERERERRGLLHYYPRAPPIHSLIFQDPLSHLALFGACPGTGVYPGMLVYTGARAAREHQGPRVHQRTRVYQALGAAEPPSRPRDDGDGHGHGNDNHDDHKDHELPPPRSPQGDPVGAFQAVIAADREAQPPSRRITHRFAVRRDVVLCDVAGRACGPSQVYPI